MTRLSGKNALSEIDKALTEARQSLTAVDGDYGSARNALARLKQDTLSGYAALARMRLVRIEQGDLIGAIDQAESEVPRILAERKQAMAVLEAKISQSQAALAADEEQREHQQAAVAAASDALDAAEGEAQTALAADLPYQAQLQRTDEADFIADQAEAKAEAAREDRIEKGRPYEQDPLFSYLWARRYGTSHYRALPFTRWLDARVARLCDYEPARQSYALLTEIPLRLSEHATSMRAEFEREADRLVELEVQAAAAAKVPQRKADLEAEEEALDTIDAKIAAHEDRIRGLVGERQRYSSGQDTLYARSIEVLSTALQRESLTLLRQRAERTLDRSDDDIVERLAELDDETDRIERNLEEFRRLHEIERNRVNQLEDIRRRFKTERFDDSLSEFKDWALIALVLREFLRGSARSNDVWRTIKRQQRMRPGHANPNFGTLKFPRAPKHGPWRMPPGGMGRRGGFGGGGFKTGGGFKGGGGFKTGGGF